MAEQSKLMSEAMAGYGLKPEHVLSSKEYKDHVVIVTKGGRKVSFAPNDKVEKLSQVEMDGQVPESVLKARAARKARK